MERNRTADHCVFGGKEALNHYRYHEHRPHQGLRGRTPREVLDEAGAKNNKASPRRQRAPPKRRSKMRPRSLVLGFVEGRRHLPVVKLQRAA